MPADLSEKAQEILSGLLRGKSLDELAPSGDRARIEVEEYLSAGTEPARAPRRASAARKRTVLPAAAPSDRAVAYSDGASRGNPGPAAIGILVLDADGSELAAEGHTIGRTTNNVAEYRGAIAALEKALDLGLTEIELRMDSELVVKQINGQYRVKQAALADLKGEVNRLLAGFRAWRVCHVRREQNAVTDRLANEALDDV